MPYAKIDSEGNVIEFPISARNFQQLDDSYVELDTYKFKPKDLKWYQGAWYESVEKVDDTYCVRYRIGNKKFSSDEEKENVFKYFIEAKRGKNQLRYDNNQITKEQYAANLAILDSIKTNDPSFYDDLEKLIF